MLELMLRKIANGYSLVHDQESNKNTTVVFRAYNSNVIMICYSERRTKTRLNIAWEQKQHNLRQCGYFSINSLWSAFTGCLILIFSPFFHSLLSLGANCTTLDSYIYFHFYFIYQAKDRLKCWLTLFSTQHNRIPLNFTPKYIRASIKRQFTTQI